VFVTTTSYATDGALLARCVSPFRRQGPSGSRSSPLGFARARAVAARSGPYDARRLTGDISG
jgi:hypothetical protein